MRSSLPGPLLALFLVAAVPAQQAPSDTETSRVAVAAVERLLDRLHHAAATADFEGYFGCYSSDAVFLGTDPGERWTMAQFRDYARPHFARGESAWTYIPSQRNVSLDPTRTWAWFDEVVTNARYGACRGTGVVSKVDGFWQVRQYSLSLPIPNDRFADVARQLAAGSGPAPADLVLTDARVYSFTWSDPGLDGTPAADAPHVPSSGWSPDASAVAIRDGRVVAVGDGESIAAQIGPSTQVIALDGATVLPGLVESHTHVAELGSNLNMVNLVGVVDEQEVVARVAARAAELPPGTWVRGFGWDEGAWADAYPDHEALSRATPEHPVYLRGLHGFAVWANRLALEQAGITADTESPSGGAILSREDGTPTGIVLNRATTLLDAALPVPSVEQRAEEVLLGLEALARGGYVSVHEAGVDSELLRAFQYLAERERLPLHVYAMLSARDEALCRDWLQKGPQTEAVGRLRVRAVKAYYDGALGSRGARLLQDYSDRPGQRGVSGAEYQFDRALVADMMRAGFQVAIHAIGDAGNRETLDFLDTVLPTDPQMLRARHRVEHAQVVAPKDFLRFPALGLVASMEPPHAMEDKAWAEQRLGPERIRGSYAWRTMREHGTRLAFNSDLPGSDFDIFYGLHAAITRRDRLLQPEGGWHPEQCLTPEETLRAYTGWGAYAAFAEEQRGRIAAGLGADLTVLDIDPLVLGSTEPGALLEGKVLMTLVDGNIVHDARTARGEAR